MNKKRALSEISSPSPLSTDTPVCYMIHKKVTVKLLEYDSDCFEEQNSNEAQDSEKEIEDHCKAMCEDTNIPTVYLSKDSARKEVKNVLEEILKKIAKDSNHSGGEDEDEDDDNAIPSVEEIFAKENNGVWISDFTYLNDPWGADLHNTHAVNVTVSIVEVPVVP